MLLMLIYDKHLAYTPRQSNEHTTRLSKARKRLFQDLSFSECPQPFPASLANLPICGLFLGWRHDSPLVHHDQAVAFHKTKETKSTPQTWPQKPTPAAQRSFNDFKRDGIFRNHNYVRASAFNGLTSRNTSKSIGESNAVFLRGVGGDAATEPHKSGCWGYPEEEFSGTHKLVYKNHGVLSRRELSVKLPKLA